MKKVLVIGATGLVGSRFIELSNDKLDIIAVDEKTIDITDKEAVDKYFDKNAFDTVLNFAAVTNVDGAEKERGNENGLVWKLNVIGPKNLAEACMRTNNFLVQVSTDFVFKGDEENPGPYSENTQIPNELDSNMGWYGWTKNRAENVISNSGCRLSIVRIAYPFYYKSYGLKLDIAKNYLQLFDEGKLFPLFNDQNISVVNVDDLVEPLVKIIENELSGVFHLVSKDTVTPYEFASYLLEKARNARDVVQKGSMVNFMMSGDRTPRPRLGGLKTEISEKKLGMDFRTWHQMIDDFTMQIEPK